MNKILIVVITGLFVSFGAATSQSVDFDRQLGAENARMVEAQMGIYDDVQKTDYIRSVGKRLLSQLEDPLFEYQFNIVPDKSPNAFALPGGYIYITTGLIPILESEDELACILAHEIIHSNNRHTIRQIKKSILPRLLEVPGNLLGVINKDLGTLFNAPIETSNALLFASYSRGFETESDVEGTALAAAAGYDPAALSESLNRLSESIEVAIGQKETKSYFNDHPYTPDRVSTINKHVAELKWENKQKLSDDFLYEFDGLLFGDSPSMGIINENQFLHPDINFSITFPKGWEIQNQPTNVGAYHPTRQGALFVSLEEQGQTLKTASQNFMDSLEEEYRDKLTANESVLINGRKGHLISFEETSSDLTMYAYVLWLPVGKNIFKLIGFTPLEYRPLLEEAAVTLRSLTEAELNSITINLIQIERAKEGETIEALSTRTGNTLNTDLTRVINNLGIDERLKINQQIKIVRASKYKMP